MTDQPATTGSGNAETVSEAPTFMPATDIVETKDAVLMLLDVPGADPDSLNVALEKQELRVTARATSSAPPGYTLMHAEYRDGNYERAFTLSDQVDGERVDAIFKDGVLRLTLPKAGTSQARKIEVKAA
jgi:HSP20 family molecular chaperone IbpA